MNKAANTKIAIIGAGAWGTALASVCANNGNQAVIWGRDARTVKAINLLHQNPDYLPDINLPETLRASDNISECLNQASLVLLVTPAQTIGPVANSMIGSLEKNIPIIVCAKGINRKTGKLPAETLSAILPNHPIAALSGPSFASDVARGLPTAVTLACQDRNLAVELAAILSGASFRVYASPDVLGVELGGALKNVIALAVGVSRGLGLGASAEAALIARGFAELSRLAVSLGANQKTLMGLSGLGDLVLTCSSAQSRNFSFGMALGRAEPTRHLPLAEGALTAPIALELARQKSVDCPIIETVVSLLETTITARQAMQQLLSRPLKLEN